MEVYKRIVLNKASYEKHFSYIQVVEAEGVWWVMPEKYDPSEYTQHYITKQPSLAAVEAFLEGCVKGHCKPRFMFE